MAHAIKFHPGMSLLEQYAEGTLTADVALAVAAQGRQGETRQHRPPFIQPAADRTTGELLDRYGTPYFFHAESGTRMTITSAGPDKKIHTPDDETFVP